MERITAALIALISFIAYPALFVVIATGVSGCDDCNKAEVQHSARPPRRTQGLCRVRINYRTRFEGQFSYWIERTAGDMVRHGLFHGPSFSEEITVPCATTLRWNGDNGTTSPSRWLCSSWMGTTATPYGEDSVRYWVDDDPTPQVARCQHDDSIPGGGGNFIIRL